MLGHWRRPPQAGGLCQVRVPPGGQLGATDIPEGEELRLLRPSGPLGGLSHPGPPSCASPCALGWPRAVHAFSRELATNRRTVAGGPALGGSGICSPAPVPGSAEGHPPHGTRDTYRGGWKPDGRAGRWAKGRPENAGKEGRELSPRAPGACSPLRSEAGARPGAAVPDRARAGREDSVVQRGRRWLCRRPGNGGVGTGTTSLGSPAPALLQAPRDPRAQPGATFGGDSGTEGAKERLLDSGRVLGTGEGGRHPLWGKPQALKMRRTGRPLGPGPPRPA